MRFTFLLALCTLVFFSCQPMEEEKEGNCLTAVINGAEFEAETTSATATDTVVDWGGQTNQETDLLTIIGVIPNLAGDTETVTITFACSELTSDLDFVEDGQTCGIAMTYQLVSFSDPTAAVIVMAANGSVSIESLSEDRISGTFSFSGEGNDGMTYDVTNGFFDTTINKQDRS